MNTVFFRKFYFYSSAADVCIIWFIYFYSASACSVCSPWADHFHRLLLHTDLFKAASYISWNSLVFFHRLYGLFIFGWSGFVFLQCFFSIFWVSIFQVCSYPLSKVTTLLLSHRAPTEGKEWGIKFLELDWRFPQIHERFFFVNFVHLCLLISLSVLQLQFQIFCEEIICGSFKSKRW